ncbi:MAG: nucleoside phosphorylase [Anaerolineae bacterium]
MRRDYPILEFDAAPKAIIEPTQLIEPADAPEHCVICFFQEVISKLQQDQALGIIFEDRWEDAVHRFYELKVDGRRLALFHPGVGGPIAAGMLEEAIALGCRKFIACGGAGVLDRDPALSSVGGVPVGHIIVPRSAVRDEGTSYHYLPPGREVEASPEGIAAIERVLQKHGIAYLVSKTWTTDAPYRETPAKVALRRSEGCLTVEMEAAAFFAVARFRGVSCAQMLYAGDDVSGQEWDHRDWANQTTIRERMFWLAAEACLAL